MSLPNFASLFALDKASACVLTVGADTLKGMDGAKCANRKSEAAQTKNSDPCAAEESTKHSTTGTFNFSDAVQCSAMM